MQPDSFTVQIIENEYVVYDTELLIRYNLHIGIFSYSEINPVNVVFDQTFTTFKKKLSKENCAVRDCHFFLSMNIKDSTKEAIIYYVQSYAKQHLCEIVGTINEEQLQNINKCDKCRCDIDRIIHPNNLRVDLSINMPVDILLKKAINYTKQNIRRHIINMPEIKKTFYKGLILGITIPCYFNANNGILRDFSNLKRTEDVIISNVGRTQSIQAGFELSAKFEYNYYDLAIGFVTFSGNILGTIDRLRIAAKLIIDYDNACNVNLEYFKVKSLGQIALQMTGLGLFNDSIINEFTSLINTTMHDEIVEEIEVKIKDLIEPLLHLWKL